MEENKLETNAKSGLLSLLAIVRKNLVLIILIVIIGILGGLGLGFAFPNTRYTAKRSVLLHASVGSGASGDLNNNATITKLLLPNVADNMIFKNVVLIEAQKVFEERGNDGKMSSKDISTVSDEDAESIIFYICYTDVNSDIAKEKLECLIEGFNNFAKGEDAHKYFNDAKDVSLIDLQNSRTIITSSSSRKKLALIGTAIGIVVAALVVYLKTIFDNTVRSREEYEELTGSSVLACINKQENS